MEHFSKPSDYMNLTKRQLAYKLAEALSYIRRIDPNFGLFRFQREFADWVGTSGDSITLDKVQCPVPECFKTKKVNMKAISRIFGGLSITNGRVYYGTEVGYNAWRKFRGDLTGVFNGNPTLLSLLKEFKYDGKLHTVRYHELESTGKHALNFFRKDVFDDWKPGEREKLAEEIYEWLIDCK